jgi:hypothetical protein
MNKPNLQNAEWPEEKLAELRRLAGTMSAQKVADALGVSKNAVVGKAKRKNISLVGRNALARKPGNPSVDLRRGAFPAGHPETWGRIMPGYAFVSPW